MFGSDYSKSTTSRTKLGSNKNTVFGELKLSDQLMNQIEQLRADLTLNSINKSTIEKNFIELTNKFALFQKKYEVMSFK